MPWHIVSDSADCPTSKPWAVVKDSDGSVAGCHATEAGAKKQIAALYATEEAATMSTTLTDSPVSSTYGLVRARRDEECCHVRAKAPADDDPRRTLHGYFAVFDKWTEIDSVYEGRFMERVAPGAFTETIAARWKGNPVTDQVKVLYDHGQDPTLGNKPLGTIASLEEDSKGARYEVKLTDTDYNRDFLVPTVEAGLLGASFRFKVAAEEWDEQPPRSKANPDRLPERTITRVDPLYEFGPVTFPAYPTGTDAGIRTRSLTERYIDLLLHDPLFAARFTERAGLPVVEELIASLRAGEDADEESEPPPPPEQRAENDESAPPAAPPTYTPTVRPPLTAERRQLDREALEAMIARAAARQE